MSLTDCSLRDRTSKLSLDSDLRERDSEVVIKGVSVTDHQLVLLQQVTNWEF